MFLLAVIVVQTPIVAAEPAPDADVVVIGKRLAKWRGRISTTIGITICKTKVSTGDKAIDEVGCSALRQCWSTYRPRLAAAKQQQRKAEGDEVRAVETALGQCVKTARDGLVAQLVARRREPKP